MEIKVIFERWISFFGNKICKELNLKRIGNRDMYNHPREEVRGNFYYLLIIPIIVSYFSASVPILFTVI